MPSIEFFLNLYNCIESETTGLIMKREPEAFETGQYNQSCLEYKRKGEATDKDWITRGKSDSNDTTVMDYHRDMNPVKSVFNGKTISREGF